MRQMILLTVLIYQFQIQSIISIVPYEVWPDLRFFVRDDAPLDCSQYSHDYEILSSFGFIVSINPLLANCSDTFAQTYANDNIYHLNVANQTSLPATVFCLKHLRKLDVRNTNFYQSHSEDETIRQLPSEIERLASSLTHLSIYDTTITHLPEQIGKLTRLHYLQLSNTGLVALPDSIGNLSALWSLYLDDNQLTSLPTSMANMHGLLSVSFSHNLELRSIQALNGLSSLSSLYTSNCAIERLPLNLPNVNFLDMSFNNLIDLINIGTLGNNSIGSKYFNFNNNYIRYIPSQIRHVNNISLLDVRNNELTTLATDLFNMTSLRHLYIRGNRFSEVELQTIVNKFNQTNPNIDIVLDINDKCTHHD